MILDSAKQLTLTAIPTMPTLEIAQAAIRDLASLMAPASSRPLLIVARRPTAKGFASNAVKVAT